MTEWINNKQRELQGYENNTEANIDLVSLWNNPRKYRYSKAQYHDVIHRFCFKNFYPSKTGKRTNNNNNNYYYYYYYYYYYPVNHEIKLKECENTDKYLDLAREVKKQWNMKLKIIPIVTGAFGTVSKGLLKGLEDLEVGGRVETIQTTVLLEMARILRRVLETWGDLLSLNLLWKTCRKLAKKRMQQISK